MAIQDQVDSLLVAEVTDALDWAKDDIDAFRQGLVRFLCEPVDDFDVRVVDTDACLQLCKNLEYGQLLYNRILWSEFDQYIFAYRVKTLRLFRERIISALSSADNRLTFACIARQIIEIGIGACANQWVLTSATNFLRKTLSSQRANVIKHSGVIWTDLENFAILLTSLSRASRRQLSQTLDQEASEDVGDSYVRGDYSPPTFRQFEIVDQMATYWNSEVPGGRLKKGLIDLQKGYRFLCKLVHPSAHMYGIHKSDPTFSNDDLDQALILHFYKCIDSLRMLLRLFFADKAFVQSHLYDLMVSQPFARGNSGYIVINDPELMPGVLNRYRDLVLTLGDGSKLEICKAGEFNSSTKEIARQIEQLSEQQKASVREFVDKMTHFEHSE